MSPTLLDATANSGSAATGRSANTQGSGARRGNRGGVRRGAPATATGSTAPSNRASIFKGNTDGMDSIVFERYEELHNRCQCAKTMEALEAYINKNLKYSEDLAPLFANPMANPEIQEPDNIAEGATIMKRMIFAEDVKEFVRRTRFLAQEQLATVHSEIWGQCSKDMKSKAKTHIGYKEKVTAHDCAWLLKQIKSMTLQFDVSQNAYLSLLDAGELPTLPANPRTDHRGLRLRDARIVGCHREPRRLNHWKHRFGTSERR